MADMDNSIHPITTHVRHAAEHLRQANHATFSDRREVTELYDTLGALDSAIRRLPQLIEHLRRIVAHADAGFYRHDDESAHAADTLNLAQQALSTALTAAGQLKQALGDAWCDIGHLRLHDPDATDPA